MHWNEQQTSTNWRLSRIKIWSGWSELMKYTYILAIVLPAIKRVAGDSAGQCTSASACKTIELSERKTPDFISPDLWPPNSPNLNLVDYELWGSCNSGSIRRRSRMWMNSRSDWLKSGLVWSRTLSTLLSMHGETGTFGKTVSQSDQNVNQMWSTRVILIK